MNYGLCRFTLDQFLSGLGPPINPVPEKLSPEPVLRGAKGDFVWLVFEHEERDPRDPSRLYHFKVAPVFRVANFTSVHWTLFASSRSIGPMHFHW